MKEYNIVFDYRAFYDHYPSGLMLSEPGNVVAASYYIDSDTAAEMFEMLQEYMCENDEEIDFENSTYTMVYQEDEIFSPVLSVKLSADDLHYLAKKRRSGEEIKPIVDQLFICDGALKEQLSLTVSYAINLVEQEVADL